jgi:DNA topoisomerase-1
VAFAVVGLLERHFGRLVDYNFTAAMEDELDAIAAGSQHRTDWLSGFYFGAGGARGAAGASSAGGSDGARAPGNGAGPDGEGTNGSVARAGGLKKLVGVNLEEIDAREVNAIPLFSDAEGREVVVRVGRYGPYLERIVDGQSQRANLPEDLPPDELTPEVAEQLFAVPQEGRVLGADPVTGNEIVAKEGRYGPYVTELLPDADSEARPAKQAKPRTSSLFRSMSLDTVTLEDALRLLSLPRVVGTDPESGDEITAQNGRYGPYLKKGSDSRSLDGEEQIFTITLDEALKIYAQPKQRGRGRAAGTAPLRELGTDPVTGKQMVIKEGRFGPYVTEGETNASLRKGDTVEDLTDERAAELLAERRAKAGVKAGAAKGGARRAGTTTKRPTRRKASTSA